MRKALISLVLMLVFAPLARADLKQYLDEQTLLAAEADLTKVNPALLEPWIREALAASGMSGGKAPAMTPQEVAQLVGRMNAWLIEVSKAGGKHIYVLAHFGLIKDGGLAVIIPAEAGGDAKKLASLLNSGRADGPASSLGSAREHAGQIYPTHAEIINGNVAVVGRANAVAYVRTLKPAARADIDAALAALGDSPVKIVVAPPLAIRAMLASQMPERIYDQTSTVLTKHLQWIAAGVALPPKPTVQLIAQCAKQPEAAKSLHHIVTHFLAEASGVPPMISPDMAKMLTPTLANDRLTLTADNEKLMAIARELALPLREARRQALMAKSMMNMKQILMAGKMHMTENKGKWPDDLKPLQRYIPNMQQLMKNPRNPQADPAYVYLKPANTKGNTAEKMVLYESHKEFGGGVAVGFLDGHVEFITDKTRFDELLAQTAVDQPAP